MSIRVKGETVCIVNLHPALWTAILVWHYQCDEENAWDGQWPDGDYGPDHGETIITSGGEVWGKHGATSLHYAMPWCCAVDLRTRHLKRDAIETVASRTRRALGPDFDVVVESDHVHIEVQNKRRDASGKVG